MAKKLGIRGPETWLDSGGVGWIVWPSIGQTREDYIKNCFLTNTVAIQAGSGKTIYQNVPIPPNVLEQVDFPSDTTSFGSAVVWVKDNVTGWPLVANILTINQFDQHNYGERRYRRTDGDNVVEVIWDAVNAEWNVNVTAGPQSKAAINLNVTGTNGDSEIKVNCDQRIEVVAPVVEVQASERIMASIEDGDDQNKGVTVTIEGDVLRYATRDGKSSFEVSGSTASFNGGGNRGLVNIAQIESLVQALMKDLTIASTGANLSSWMSSEMKKMEDKNVKH